MWRSLCAVPYSKVYGVSTFYHFFTLKPQGEHTCVVCTGTACYIKGAQRLLDTVGDAAGIKAGETTADGKVSLLTARCVGSCGLAPAVVFDGQVAGKVTPDSVSQVAGQVDQAGRGSEPRLRSSRDAGASNGFRLAELTATHRPADAFLSDGWRSH